MPKCGFFSVFLIAIVSAVAMAAAPVTNPAAQADDAKPIVETPAVPFLTLLLARDPAVHAELKLSSPQIEHVNVAVAEVDNSFWVLRDVPVAQCGEKLDALTSQLRKQLAKALTAVQLQRFDEILLQARGVKALASAEVAARLKLSTDQLERLRRLIVDGSAPPKAVDGGVENKATTTATSAAKSPDIDSRAILAVLTSNQSAQLAKLTGEPFDLGQVRQVGCIAPELQGVTAWINGDKVELQSLRGQVVAVHFWAFGCINCVRNLPHYQSWYEKFSKSQLTIVGIHTPETERERSVENLRQNVQERGIQYPVAFDAASENWKAWGNNMWPSVYLVDKQGRVRYWWYGELNWQGARGEEFMRRKIGELIAEE